MVNKIAILGDFNPVFQTLHKLNDSTRDIQKYLKTEIQFDWIPTDLFNSKVVFEQNKYKGLWIAPGSPYKDMNNVLKAIKYARQNEIPTLGNCGGFQHMIIEFAINVCGIKNAAHEEVTPDSPELLIKKLACSLIGEQEQLKILNQNSRLYDILQTKNLTAKYFCSFGLNERYLDILNSNGLSLTSISEDGNYRSFEITSHPFFIGTLFQPALTSTKENPDPLIIAFVKTALKN
ncbi:glutamine amidotransferase-related protein [Marinigracilibium pacificum]|uniref:CTP synthase (glutamine hydrolyzing) n=1 Tax=Marinigracilibium pacificum TaxID=2729599 RepID=A0A848IZU5_9BACT|nr:CTP synthase [Marinigracilibium pacificum]NMM47820.1 CTP synthase [Marinigracilibium pacificum]